jgi:hypothetical protein
MLMSRWIFILALGFLFACGDNSSAQSDAAPPPPDAAPPDTGGALTLSSCLDRPNELPRPPSKGLTCDLLPPGMTLTIQR